MAIIQLRRHSDRSQGWPPGRSGLSSPASRRPVSHSPIEEHVERAARIQRSLLPDFSTPLGQYQLASLYRPCEILGGDFYDLVQDRTRAVLLVSDVMGHGVEAALPTMLLRAAFEEAAKPGAQSREIMRAMDARLQGMIAGGAFVAAAIAILDSAGDSLRLANAGLPHPFILRAESRRVEQVRINGFPLGLLDAGGFSRRDAVTLKLAPGDVLLIASDGLESIENARGEPFADRRLRQALQHAAGLEGSVVIDSLMREAVAFAGGTAMPDDISLVAVTRRRRLAEEATTQSRKRSRLTEERGQS